MNPELPALQPRRILVRGVNWLGDAVMTTPALQRLRERFPSAEIILLTHEKLATLWERHPSLNRVLTFAPGESPWAISRRLRAHGFELALVLPNSPRSALETWLARIPHRVGYARSWRNWLLTHAIPTRPGHVAMPKRSDAEINRLLKTASADSLSVERRARSGERAESKTAHQLHEYLHLVAALGASAELLPPHLAVDPDEMVATAAKFKLPAGAGETRPIFGLNPGAEYGPAKRWPLERFIAAAKAIHQRTNCLWLIFGGPADVPAATALHSALNPEPSAPPVSYCLAGQTSLRELMALLKRCQLLLTNDTGPMHVAAALGTSVIVPFGSTSPELTGPGLPGDPRHRLLRSTAPCSPCFRRECPVDFCCMTGITVEQVVEAVVQVHSLSPVR